MDWCRYQRRLRVMQVGFGNIGLRRVYAAKKHHLIDIVAVVDVKNDRLKLASELLGDTCLYDNDYLHALQTVRPEAVIVSTPNYLHAPISQNSLKSGSHVLCEKPLASSVREAERCRDISRSRGLVLKVGSNHRFWRGVTQLLRHVEDGSIGKIQEIKVEIGYLLPDVRSEWYRELSFSGGGTLIDNSPHALNLIEKILKIQGNDAIASVRCKTSNDVLGLKVEDLAEGVLLSRGGVPIKFASTWGDGAYRMNVELGGALGRIVLDSFDQLVFETADRRETLSYFDVPAGESWDLDMQSFVDAILLNIPPAGSAEEGIQNLRVIEAMYRSAERGAEEIRI